MTALPALQDPRPTAATTEATSAEAANTEVYAAGRPEARPRRLAVESSQAPYRRPPVVRKHRRRRALGLLKLLAQALTIVGLPTAIGVWALTTPQLAVRQLHISPSERIPAPWIEGRLEPYRGRNLLRLPLADVRQQLEGHPWLDSVSLRKRLPDGLEVAIVEKVPVAVLETDGPSPAFVDAHGGIIAPVDAATETAGLPLIRAATVTPRGLAGAIAAAGEFDELGAAWGGQLESIEVLGPEDFRLVARGLPFPLLVRRGSLGEKHEIVRRLVPEIVSRIGPVAAVDLRFAQRIVLQPEPGSEGLVPQLRTPSRG